MGNTEQAPSKRVRIVLCAAVFALAAAVPGAGLAADWTSGKVQPSADWTSGLANPTADWTSGSPIRPPTGHPGSQPDRRLDVEGEAERRLDVEGEAERRLDLGKDHAERRLDVAGQAQRGLVELDRRTSHSKGGSSNPRFGGGAGHPLGVPAPPCAADCQ